MQMYLFASNHAFVISALCLISLYGNEIHSLKLPSAITPCHRSDPNFEECIPKALMQAIELLRNGYKQIKLPTLEPLHIEKVAVGNEGGSVSIKETLTNIKLYKLTEGLEIRKFNIDLDKGTMHMSSFNKLIKTSAEYDLQGSILVLPISGNGISNSTYYDMISTHDIKFGYYNKKDGKKYIKITDWKMHLDPQNLHLHLTNLFNGDERLSENMLQILNENWRLLHNELEPVFSEAISVFFIDYVNRFFSKFSFEECFPL